MSKQTLEALDAAIRAHAKDADEDDSMVIDWVIGYATLDHEEAFGISYATPPASTPHASVGLAEMTSRLMLTDISGEGYAE